ncbi:hypothetical protein BDV06DRAFT_228419 [Aspergillus oleicola]
MGGLHLLSPLMRGVDLLLSENEEERKTALQLARYGANCAPGWIGNSKNTSSPVFGITNLGFVLKAILHPADRVRVLRDVFNSYGGEPEGHIIRFRTDDDTWAYASLSPPGCPVNRKRNRSEFESATEEELGPDSSSNENWIFLHSRTDIPDLDINMLDKQSRGSEDVEIMEFLEDHVVGCNSVFWDLTFGIHNLAGVYRKRGISAKGKEVSRPQVPPSDIYHLLNAGALNLQMTVEQVENFLLGHQPSHRFSLLALGRVIEHYRRELPHFTLSMSVIKQTPTSWAWAKSLVSNLENQHLVAASMARNKTPPDSIYPTPLTRQEIFASILQFQSGTVSVNLEEMDSIMAISSGNSLFIAQRLLEDPIPPGGSASLTVTHAIGNVGRPGIALLFSPEQPLIREHDVEKWHVVNHNPFDGSSSGGMFGGSSLHMSLTGWEGPLRAQGPSGFRGMEAYHLETRISMHDQGEWVADLNILEALDSFPDMEICGVLDQECDHIKSFSACESELVAIDCWEELLLPPKKPMVLRSGSSWMVRLTAASIAYAQGYNCFLLPTDKSFCWSCAVEGVVAARSSDLKTLFIY